MMKSFLSRFESKLQKLVEHSTAKLFPTGSLPHRLAEDLLTTFHASTTLDTEGNPQAPDIYSIFLDPALYAKIEAPEALASLLARSVEEAAQQAAIAIPSGSPQVFLSPDENLANGELEIITQTTPGKPGETSEIGLQPVPLVEDPVPGNAFLIVRGSEVFPLTHPITHIGRDASNDLVLDHPHISRTHAQLRLLNGNFILFDLDSTGGTQVNRQDIDQHKLSPGDVISLAGITLVFGRDEPLQPDATRPLLFDLEPPQ